MPNQAAANNDTPERHTPQSPPIVVVKVSGGVIQGVVSSQADVRVLALDYDTEGMDECDVTAFPEPGQDKARPGDEAVAWFHDYLVDPDYAKHLCHLAQASSSEVNCK